MTTCRINSTRRLLGAIAGVTLAAGTLAACGPQDSAEFDPADQTQETAEEPEQEPDDEAGEAAELDDEEPADSGDRDRFGPQADESDEGDEPGNSYVRGPEEATEAITYDLPDDEADVTVGLHTLQVAGDVMLLELSFTPQGGGGSYGFNNLNMGRALMPLLHDRENLKQYSVLGTGSNRWASNTTVSGTRVESGQSLMFYAHYAAPEDDIDTINISVIDGLVEFADAEIQW